jgi:hypothetical protein
MKGKPIIAVVYNLMMALATAALGAVVLSWPLLAIFVKAQKTDLIVKKVTGNNNEKLYSTFGLFVAPL